MILLFLFILFSLIVLFVLYVRKYQNPYKLIFIFGKKGSGKSMLMVKEILRHQKLGWICYTDISDINIPGVRIITSKDLSVFTPEPHSCLFLDEAGILFDNRKFKTFDDGLRDWFKLMRKYKCKCFMNSQSFDVDIKIRTLTDSMILQTSILNCISVSRPIIRSITLTEPSADAESRIADRLKFDRLWHWKFLWMPKYFKYFDSFSAPAREFLPYQDVSIGDGLSVAVQSLFSRSVGKTFAKLKSVYKRSEDV